MKGRLKHYRPSRYRPYRRHIDRRVLIVLAAAGIILLVSILLGAYLNSRVEEYEQDKQTGDGIAIDPPEYIAYKKITTTDLTSVLLPVSAYSSDNALDGALSDITQSGARGVSFELSDSRGIPRYSSALYRDTFASSGGKVDLERFITKAESAGVSVTAFIEMYSFGEEEESARLLRRSLELALISESYRAGVRRVLISGAESMSSDDMYSMMQSIRRESPELAVGILVPYSAEKLADISYSATLAAIFDFVCVDASEALSQDCTDKKATPAEGEGALESALAAIGYPLGRYSMCVFMRAGDGCSHCSDYASGIVAKYNTGGYVLLPCDTLHK